MDRIKSLAVFVDPRMRAHPGVDKAARIAAGFHARVHLLICDAQPAAAASRYFDAETCRLAQERLLLPHRALLEGLAEPLRAAGITVHTEVLLEAPRHAVMLRRIAELRPSLVIKDTHDHSLLRRALLTHLDWLLLRDCPAPLLLVKNRSWLKGPVRIAGAVDPGHPDDKPWSLDHEILGALEYWATGVESEVSVVNAFCALEEYAAATAGGAAEFAFVGTQPIEAARRCQAEALRALMLGHGIPPERVHLVDGSPVEALPAFVAQHRIDVLVMGIIARGNLFEHFIGSTAERVLDLLECDVLALKPESLSARMWEAGSA
jgi:universal stress protein E